MPEMSGVRTRLERYLPRGWGDFWLQLAIFWAFYISYEGTRGVSDGARDEAFANANRVIDAERALGIFWELDVQNWALNAPGFVEFTANRTYFACQFLISYGFMLWAYFRRNHAWYFMRNVLIVAGFIGLIGYVAFPTAPPRMFPELGFVDTLNGEAVSHQTGIVETFANPYAAMPSLHSAFAMSVGIAAAVVARHWWSRGLWALWGPTVIMATIATGNHFWLDAAAGITVAGMGLLISAYVVRGGRVWGSPVTYDPAPRTVPAGVRALGR